MKWSLAVLLLLLVPYFVAIAQEPMEPITVAMVCVDTADFQMRWHNGVWETITATGWTDNETPPVTHPAVEFLDGMPVAIHSHVSGLGHLILEAESPDSTSTTPRFVRFGIPVSSIPENPPGTSRWWGIAHVRWRCRAQANGYFSDPSVWSERSWWVLVIGMFTVSVPVNT